MLCRTMYLLRLRLGKKSGGVLVWCLFRSLNFPIIFSYGFILFIIRIDYGQIPRLVGWIFFGYLARKIGT